MGIECCFEMTLFYFYIKCFFNHIVKLVIMKKVFICLTIGVIFASSCSSDSSESKDTDKKDSTAVVEEKGPVLDSAKVYGFMELKELYNQNWKGEEEGNTFLDGKTVTISGEVFSRG